MKESKRTFLKDFLNTWSICGTECGACYYHGPIIPHNWLDLPPHDWGPPSRKCPSFEYFKFKAYSGVGRGDLASIVHDDSSYPITEDLMHVMYTCTGCGICSEICYKLRPLTAIFAIREELLERGGQLPEPLAKIDSDIDKVGNIFGATRPLKIMEGVPTTGKDLYFAGCIARFQRPEVVEATVKVLRAAGIDVAHLGNDERCCGLIPRHDGNTPIFERMAAQNIDAFRKAGAKRVIVSCAHCYKTLRVDYRLIAGDLPFEVVHIAELFSQLIDQKKIELSKDIERKVTYHDPCFLGRYCHILDEPRKVLRNIPGLELVEMERYGKWSYCCGSGTKITSACYPEFTAAVTKERLEEGKQVADTIVTACSTCYNHMDRATRQERMGLEIIDLPVLVAKAMGISLD
ncbi:MAG: (Fe-S)-binding protein [Thermodesulfobacteriota bacterium]|jgi:heterodisulfide reductase subunit D